MFISSRDKQAINLDNVIAIIHTKNSKAILFDHVPVVDGSEHCWKFKTEEEAEETYRGILKMFAVKF